MTYPFRLLISGVALGIFAARIIFPELRIDVVALGLLALAVLPWMTSLLESAELPGGIKITFRDVREAGDKVVSKAGLAPEKEGTRTEGTYQPLVFPTYDPNLILVDLRIEIEQRLRALLKKHGLPEQRSLTAMFRQLRDAAILDDASLSGLQELIRAGNNAAHGARVEDSVGGWAREYGPEVLGVLDAKLHEV